MTLQVCPTCGGSLVEERVDCASTTDIPALPRPMVPQDRVTVCRCTVGGKQGRGQHPAGARDQYGATAHRVGDRTMAAAHALHSGIGIPVRKVPVILEVLTGVTLTQGALTQDAMQRARGELGAVSGHWRTAVPAQPVVYTDDTGWRVGGEAAHLMACKTAAVPGYQIRPTHRHEEVQEGIPPDSDGVMVTDRGRSSEAQACDQVKQQQCLAHILRALREVLQTKKAAAALVGHGSRRC